MKVKQTTPKLKRQARVRGKLRQISDRPRLSVDRSNKHLFAQLIDDVTRKTLVGVSTKSLKGTKTEKAFELGKLLASKAKELKVTLAVFDRGSFRFHGRVKAVADGAREGGLKI